MDITSIDSFDTRFMDLIDKGAQVGGQSKESEFDIFLEPLEKMKGTQEVAKSSMYDVLMGNSDNAHSSLITMEQAKLQMQLASSVRDKAVSGINQLLNMQV